MSFDFTITIDHINFYAWTLFWLFIYKKHWTGIWKGVCGGNGIPQPDEFIRFAATIVFICDCGLVMFLHKEVSLPFMGLVVGTIGITSAKDMGVGNWFKKEK